MGKLPCIMIYRNSSNSRFNLTLRLQCGHVAMWVYPWSIGLTGFNWPATAYRTDSEKSCGCEYCDDLPPGTWVFNDNTLTIRWRGWRHVDRTRGVLNDDGTVTWRRYWRWPIEAFSHSQHDANW